MNEATKKALEDSIEHWRRMETGNRINGETPHGSFCALCAMFFSKYAKCEGCPVAEDTGYPGCYETPYYAAKTSTLILSAYLAQDRGLDSEEFKLAAKEMREFLEGLREE